VSWHIREAVRRLGEGGVVAYPTETVYGLGCDPFNAAAVLRLLDLKRRNIDEGLILIASDFSRLEPLLLPLTAKIRDRVTGTWPGPVTWTLPCLPETPIWLRGLHDSLAVRVTSHPIARALCKAWNGPLVSTSANRSGNHPATSGLRVRIAFDGALDYILHGTVAGSGKPSEIRDAMTGRVLRGGAVELPDDDR
jgi:L-threonylcarbamoyladenylate synthase